MSKVKRGKALSSQSRELIWNASKFFQEEADTTGPPKIPVKSWLKRTGECLGVSLASVKRIRKEGQNLETGFSTPGKKRRRKFDMTQIDEFDMAVIRRKIHAMYERGIIPTLDKLLPEVRDATNFKGGRTSLWRIVRKMGFKYAKADGRKYLLERSDIIALRHSFLRRMRENRNLPQPRPVVYQDETWLNAHHSVSKCWQHPGTSQQGDDRELGLKIPPGQGSRLIINHAGSSEGFIPNGLLLFAAKSKSGDYHDEMNGENFKKWFMEMLLPNIPPNAIIVIDNAPYHSMQTEKAPTTATRKADMIAWLQNKGISFAADMLKPELYELIKRYKPREKKYVIDEIAREHGHEIVRLPPYHCDLNPIELIWANIKNYVARRNTTWKLKDVQSLCLEAVEQVTPANWRDAVESTIKVENKYWETDGILEERVGELIISLGDTDSEESEESSDSGSESEEEGNMTESLGCAPLP